jgi:microcompartment protein CcmK/EutM
VERLDVLDEVRLVVLEADEEHQLEFGVEAHDDALAVGDDDLVLERRGEVARRDLDRARTDLDRIPLFAGQDIDRAV